MLAIQCACGARYRLPDEAAGRKARCKKCGNILHVPAAAEDALGGDDLLGLARGEATAPPPGAAPAPMGVASAAFSAAPGLAAAPALGYGSAPAPAEAASGLRGLIRSLPGALRFLNSGNNLLQCLVAVCVLYAGTVGGELLMLSGSLRALLLGMVAFVAAEGMFAAFGFNTVHQSGSGESELPAFPLVGGLDEAWQGIVVPLFAYFWSLLLVLAPTIAYAVYASTDAANAVPEAVHTTAFLGALLLGLFVWPMLLLAMAMGEFMASFRILPMVGTILRSFPGYFICVLVVYLCAAVIILGSMWIDEGTNFFVVAFVWIAARVLVQVAGSRVIGTYYRCHEHLFDWL